MEKKDNNIEESLSKIKKAIKEPVKENKKNIKDDFVLLDNIISSPKQIEKKKESIFEKKDNVLLKKPQLPKDKKKTEKNTLLSTEQKKKNKNVSLGRLNKNVIKKQDPMANVVEKDIKPIIDKWIKKNMRSFVKKIVIEEMKLISRATEKPPKR